jgi:ribosomal protein S24E
MEILEIKKEFRNSLFNRVEILGIVKSNSNPGFEEVKKALAEKYSKSEENINVFQVKGSFGSKLFEIEAYIYDSLKDKENSIVKTRKQRKEEIKIAEEARKAEEEAKAEEAKKAKENKEAEAEKSSENEVSDENSK